MADETSNQDLQDSLRQMQAFMNNSPAAAFMKDEQGRYVYFSERMASMFYAPLSDLEGKTDFDWLPEYLATQIWTSDQLVLSTGKPLELIQTVPAADGRLLYWLVFKFPFTNASGQKFVGGVAVDITQLKETEARLSASEQRYRHLVESSQGLICSHDMKGLILSVNTAACKALGYESNEIIGRNFRDFLNSGADEQFDEYLNRIDQNSTDEGVMLLMTKDGSERTWQYHNVKLAESGESPYVLGNAQDITELKQLQERLESLSLTDELTNLNNRRGFLNLAKDRMNLARRGGESLLLIFADVDGLKRINDNFGHSAGSQVLVEAAEILKDSFRQTDVISRWGGDEFVVLLSKASDDNEAVILNRMSKKLAAFNARSGRMYELSMSFGITPIDLDGKATLDEMITEADKAMYENKRSKRSK